VISKHPAPSFGRRFIDISIKDLGDSQSVHPKQQDRSEFRTRASTGRTVPSSSDRGGRRLLNVPKGAAYPTAPKHHSPGRACFPASTDTVVAKVQNRLQTALT
jgi:hypothetical protein